MLSRYLDNWSISTVALPQWHNDYNALRCVDKLADHALLYTPKADFGKNFYPFMNCWEGDYVLDFDDWFEEVARPRAHEVRPPPAPLRSGPAAHGHVTRAAERAAQH